MNGRGNTSGAFAPRPRGPGIAVRAVAFADMVGSTALAEAHELEAFRCVRLVLRTIRRTARAFGGRIVEEAGDGALAAFAEVAGAAAWALACHEALERLEPPCRGRAGIRLRIGIHAGPVLLHGARLFGRTVTGACRLQQAAASGETLVSASVAEELLAGHDGHFRLFRAGSVTIKGTATTLAAWRLEGAVPEGQPAACEYPERRHVALALPVRVG